MRPGSFLLLVLSLTSLACYGRATVKEPTREEQNVEPALDVQNVGAVRRVFHAVDYDERHEKQCQYLICMGEKAFPAYEAILSDPTSDPDEVVGVLWILWYGEADPHHFLKQAVSRLADVDDHIRWAAVRLMERIGSPAEASQVVSLLSDDQSVAYAAAKTLATIGGPRELETMDNWLRSEKHHDDRQMREHVQKFRDELKKRLAEKKAPAK